MAWIDESVELEAHEVYRLDMEVHGLLWFSWMAQPRRMYVHVPSPVIHNYAITLALLGRPVEESYANLVQRIPRYRGLEYYYRRYGVYVYPAVVEKALVKPVLFSMGGTGLLVSKPQTRAPVPDLTVNNVYLPGTRLRSYAIVRVGSPFHEEIRGRRTLYARLGAKRYGVVRVDFRSVMPCRLVESPASRSGVHPFNVVDAGVSRYRGLMSHPAGDVALTGELTMVIECRDGSRLAPPRFVLEEELP